jgi:hypothetical protein
VKADIDRSQSSISPQVTFAMVAVIALAPSDAMNATTSATSANVGGAAGCALRGSM